MTSSLHLLKVFCGDSGFIKVLFTYDVFEITRSDAQYIASARNFSFFEINLQLVALMHLDCPSAEY